MIFPLFAFKQFQASFSFKLSHPLYVWLRVSSPLSNEPPTALWSVALIDKQFSSHSDHASLMRRTNRKFKAHRLESPS